MVFSGIAPLFFILFGQTLRASDPMPHLQRVGPVTRLIVDSQPFLILGGEVHNSSTANLEFMEPLWPKLTALNLNTVLVPVSWELLEPQEGQFDFSLVDGLIARARENHLHLILLWFGSWKNSGSTYVPAWVKTDLKRFSRAQDERGKNLLILSTFDQQTQGADARAFAALMKHLHEVENSAHTVIMVQVENEVGLLGPQRDFSPAAEAAWKEPVPQQLLAYLSSHKERLWPELLGAWGDAGFRTSGTWEQVFGPSHTAAEAFMAWQYAKYIDTVVAAGKAEYPLPMYVNAWLVQHDGELPGQYPSGGPVSRMHDIWQAGSSHIDLFAPDIYIAEFRQACAEYSRHGNPLFIPEADNSPASSNALFAFGQGALGFSVFAPEDLKADDPISRSYSALEQLAPLLLSAEKGKFAAVVQQRESSAAVDLGGYTLFVEYENKKEEASNPPAAALIINIADDEFIVAGLDISIRFQAQSKGPQNVELLEVDEGTLVNKRWVTRRRLNGDEIDSGSHVVLPKGTLTIQRVKLFRHN